MSSRRRPPRPGALMPPQPDSAMRTTSASATPSYAKYTMMPPPRSAAQFLTPDGDLVADRIDSANVLASSRDSVVTAGRHVRVRPGSHTRVALAGSASTQGDDDRCQL